MRLSMERKSKQQSLAEVGEWVCGIVARVDRKVQMFVPRALLFQLHWRSCYTYFKLFFKGPVNG